MANDKDLKLQNELKQLRKYEQDKEIALMKEKIKADREAALQIEAEQLAKGSIRGKDKSGNDITLWDEAMMKADEALKAEQMSYQDWRAAMTNLLSMFSSLSEALIQTRKENIDATISNTLSTLVILPIYDQIKDALSKSPEFALPALEYLVEYNDANELVIHPLERSDQGTLEKELDANFKKTFNDTFQKGVALWLNDLGFTPTADGKQFKDNADNVLDKATFETLKNDPQKGLNAFLSDRFELDFQERPSMR